MFAGIVGGAYAGLIYGAPADHMLLASETTFKRTGAAPRASKPGATWERASAPVVVTSSTAPGNAGYVHYFVVTGPDGEPESQVGIELPDDRIVWSFPEVGVVVSPFVASGSVLANGKSFEVVHLYGLRPFSDEQSMRVLQQELTARVAPWVEDKTPFCDEERPPKQVCVSCLGFVLRVLYPPPSPALSALPALPSDFKSARKNIYTTEDLLLYLAGVQVDAPRPVRLQRIETLAIPEPMREQLLRISAETDSARAVATSGANAPKAAAAKPRPASRSIVDLPRRVLTRRRS